MTRKWVFLSRVYVCTYREAALERAGHESVRALVQPVVALPVQADLQEEQPQSGATES